MRAIAFVGLCAALTSFAGEPAKDTAKAPAKAGPKLNRKVDKQAAEMDYGPFLHMHCGDGTNNIAYKGIILPLNKERTINVCFDTELMRVSQAWTGAWLALAGRQFADNNNDYPLVDGTLRFTTGITPGWAIADGTDKNLRDDPRGAKDQPKDGPLPRDWARYSGLYVSGEKVVLEYTVAGSRVLESFSAIPIENNSVFVRTLNIAPCDKPRALLLFESDYGTEKVTATSFETKDSYKEFKQNDPANKLSIVVSQGYGQVFDQPAKFFSALNSPEGATWTFTDNRVYLRLPPTKNAHRFTVAMLDGSFGSISEFVKALPKEAADLEPFTKGGPARYPQILETKGEVSAVADQPYVVDTLVAPADNPWKSWLRFTSVDFFKDGRAALTTWNGDLWIVSGINDKLESLKWKRYATGLHGPMGVKIVDEIVYVSCKDQLTRLKDLNNDGEADFYENFNNDCFATTNFHEYCFDLQTDNEGNFYFAKGSAIWAGSLRMTAHAGTICKISKDGTQFETIGSGLRAPNGLSIGANGEIICSDNQGNWTPLCPLNFVEKGKYYGFVGHQQKPQERERPICWIPHSMDKSTSGQVWVRDERWGPFKDNLIAVSYDCSVSKVLLENVGGVWQGGVVKFALPKLSSGLMRARFNPTDGQLYGAGLRGWSSRAEKDHLFARIRYTGKAVHMPLSVKTRKGGMDITFTNSLDPQSVNDAQNVGAEWYTVKRSGGYGSGDFGVSDPNKKGREPLEIKSMKLQPDGKTIALEIPDLKPVDNIIFKFRLKAADGTPITQELAYTVNRVE